VPFGAAGFVSWSVYGGFEREPLTEATQEQA
jgi:hypothetical protein